ncbi:MAG: acyl-CoA thioesterase [Cyclobacteriaceae bacterium]|nr:acyl-CoA thioesterase [Cyclobacteriaceae bacterium HetDA_MAG_MS6]
MSKSKPLLLQKEISVNGYDIDVLGIVSNIVYVRWFEDLRMYFLDTYYPFQELFEEGKSPVLTDTQVKYHHPLTIHDHPLGEVWMSNVNRSKWECSFEIKAGKRIHCSGVQSGYFVNVESKRPTPIPKKFHDLFSEAQLKKNRSPLLGDSINIKETL